MLEKVIRIEGVGRLRRTFWPKLPPLGRAVGVFAENGTGKSTLVAVLRSVRESSPAPIQERRTLGSKTDPIVELLVSGEKHRFDGKTWSRAADCFDVFDLQFIESHVYVGRDFGADQRHRLYRLAIGTDEVAAARRVESANIAVQGVLAKRRELEARIAARAAQQGLSLQAFTALPVESVDAEQRAEMFSQLTALTASKDLSGNSVPSPIPVPPMLNVHALRALLNESAKSIAAESAGLIRSHIESALDAGGESWRVWFPS